MKFMKEDIWGMKDGTGGLAQTIEGVLKKA